MSILSDPGHQAPWIIAGFFLFSSQGPFRAGWHFLLVQEGLGLHIPRHRNSEATKAPATLWALCSIKDILPLSHPSQAGYQVEFIPPELLSGMPESSFSSASLQNGETQQLLWLLTSAGPAFPLWHLAASLALPRKGAQIPSGLSRVCGLSSPSPAQSWGQPGCKTHCWGPTSVQPLLAMSPALFGAFWHSSSQFGQCFPILRPSKPLPYFMP